MTARSFLKSASVVVAGAAVYLPLQAAGRQATDRDTRVLAQVGSRAILVSDVQRERGAARRRDVAANRLDSFAPSATKKILDEIIAAKLLAMGAREVKLDERADVRAQIEHVMDLVLAEAMVAEIAANADVTDQRLRAHYEAHVDQFQVAGRVRARHIIVGTSAEAVALHGRLKRKADFESLARQHNIDASKEKGGDLGWISRGVMVKPFEDALFSLRVGEISPIVQTSYGFHIVKVDEIEPPRAKPFERVVAEVRQKLIAEEIAARKAALAKKHKVTVHDAVFKSVG